jgi:hypothetical protein
MSRLSETFRCLLAACTLGATASAFALTAPAAGTMQIKVKPTDAAAVEALRDDAVFDPEVRSALAHRLLDRFEAGGDKADLREALRWMARDWDQQAFLRHGPVDRKVVSDCARPVLQWYWVCNGGD